MRYIGGYKKGIAIDLRKRGSSYSEIALAIHVPKSTVVEWVKRVKLSKEQSEKLIQRKINALKVGSKKRTSRNLRVINEIDSSAPKSIKKISKKELWLMGIILYLRNGNKSKSGPVSFSSSDQFQVKLFLKWLKEVGHIEEVEIAIDLFIRSKKVEEESIIRWARISGLLKRQFNHVYINRRYGSGFIRIRVKRSSLLARQINGWIRGIEEYFSL